MYQQILNEIEVPLQTGMSAVELDRFRRKTLVLERGSMGQSVAVTDQRLDDDAQDHLSSVGARKVALASVAAAI